VPQEDEDKTRAAGLVNAFLLTVLACAALFPVAATLVRASVSGPIISLASGVATVIVIGLLYLLRRGHVRLTGILLSLAVWGVFTAPIYAFDGIRDTAMTGYFFTLVMVSLMLGGRALFSFSLLSALSTVGVFYAEQNGIITTSITNPIHPIDLVTVLATLGATALLSHATVRSIAEGYERARRNERALTESNRQLQESRAALKEHAERLIRRSIQLEAAAEVGRAATTILDTDQLIHETVELIRRRFGLYHVGLFLVDESGEWSVLRAATGEGSCQMPVDGLWLRVDETSVIGRVTSLGVPCVVSGVSACDQRTETMDPPPQTRSEMALPLRARGRVIGALDVQTTEPDAFSDDDLAVFQIAADQIAVAIENARLYNAAQQKIAERKRTEESLRESEERFRQMAELLPEIVFEMDARGILAFVNQQGFKMTGYTQEDFDQGFEGVNLFVTAERETARQSIAKILTENCSASSEYTVQRKDGSTFPVVTRTAPIVRDGKPVGLRGIVFNITGRKRAEERLARYAAELEQANEELKRFTYVASHHLRGPLVNLKGFTAELRAALAVVGSATVGALPHLDTNQQQKAIIALEHDVPEALGFIDASASELDRLVNAIQKLSRMNQRELRLRAVDVDALVQATLQALSTQLQERQAQVTAGPLPAVVADRIAMEQIWSNLLDNAVKYLDPNRPGVIKITAECKYAETAFHVRDSGRGIAEDDIDKVFAPFRRAGKQDVPGDGMGLAYVRTLVRRHGGRIWCESEPGVGTTFSFTIGHTISARPDHRVGPAEADIDCKAEQEE